MSHPAHALRTHPQAAPAACNATPRMAPRATLRRGALALAAAALAAVSGPSQAVATLMGQTVTLTFAGNAPLPLGGTLAGQFGTLSGATVSNGVELSKASNPGAYTLFGNGDFAFNIAANSLRIVYNSGTAAAGSRVEDMAFSITINDPTLIFTAAPTEVSDIFAAYNGAPNGAPGVGWVAGQINAQTVNFDLLNMRLPTAADGAGFSAVADFNFSLATVAVPEPDAAALLLAGLSAVAWRARRLRAAARVAG